MAEGLAMLNAELAEVVLALTENTHYVWRKVYNDSDLILRAADPGVARQLLYEANFTK
jgi:hypothetical protein